VGGVVRIVYVAPDGEAQAVDAKVGHNLMETAVKNGVEGIIGECGGVSACGTCRVYVGSDWRAVTGEASALEREMLDFVHEDHPDARLSCQIKASEELEGLIVHLPASQH
jgi:2Fe-2S ferredoxin